MLKMGRKILRPATKLLCSRRALHTLPSITKPFEQILNIGFDEFENQNIETIPLPSEMEARQIMLGGLFHDDPLQASEAVYAYYQLLCSFDSAVTCYLNVNCPAPDGSQYNNVENFLSRPQLKEHEWKIETLFQFFGFSLLDLTRMKAELNKLKEQHCPPTVLRDLASYLLWPVIHPNWFPDLDSQVLKHLNSALINYRTFINMLFDGEIFMRRAREKAEKLDLSIYALYLYSDPQKAQVELLVNGINFYFASGQKHKKIVLQEDALM